MTSTIRTTRSTRRSMTPTPNQDAKENITPQPDVSEPSPEVRGDSSRKRHRMSSTQLMRLESALSKGYASVKTQEEPTCRRAWHVGDCQQTVSPYKSLTWVNSDYKTITIWFQNKRQSAKRSQPSTPCLPLPIQDGISQAPDHRDPPPVQSLSVLRRVSSPLVNDTLQPATLSSVCSEESFSTPSQQEQERDDNNLPKKSLRIKPLLNVLGSLMSSKSPKALYEKDQAQPIMGNRTNVQELWQHLPSSPTAPSSVSDRGSEFRSPTRDEGDARHSKRGLTLEWACDRQTKRRRAGRDNGSVADDLNKLWPSFGSSNLRTSSCAFVTLIGRGKGQQVFFAQSCPFTGRDAWSFPPVELQAFFERTRCREEAGISLAEKAIL
ncbi:hypothetical protein EDD22DRAFT_418223 [Suillus occidentalis]|nr:hypothetical protein EDD22DRAFT_418223 [Suillus occidentalis]